MINPKIINKIVFSGINVKSNIYERINRFVIKGKYQNGTWKILFSSSQINAYWLGDYRHRTSDIICTNEAKSSHILNPSSAYSVFGSSHNLFTFINSEEFIEYKIDNIYGSSSSRPVSTVNIYLIEAE